jgi:carbonic anhydrase
LPATSLVQRTVENIRRRSSVLGKLAEEGKIKIIGAMYQLRGGGVEILG